MKKIRNSIALLCLMGFVIASCGKNHAKELARTWQVSDITSASELPDSIKTKMLEGSQMIFSKDGSYTSSGGIGADQGTYTLDKDGKNLSTISAAGKGNSVYTINDLSDEKLVLNNNGVTVTCTAVK